MKPTRQRRFEEHGRLGRPIILPPDHPAIVEGRSLFPNRVGTRPMAWRGGPDLPLKSGFHSRKIGRMVTKGDWSGMPIFTLTLEERRTCPASCANWYSCYGNHMDKSTRQVIGPELQERIVAQLFDLAAKYRRGFVLRLHVLGDFYSPSYVDFWRKQLESFPMMRVFGYTAWSSKSEIGRKISLLNETRRWRVRFSNAPSGHNTETIKMPADKTPGAIICPAQHHKNAAAISCGTCALCWSTDKTIAFLEH